MGSLQCPVNCSSIFTASFNLQLHCIYFQKQHPLSLYMYVHVRMYIHTNVCVIHQIIVKVLIIPNLVYHLSERQIFIFCCWYFLFIEDKGCIFVLYLFCCYDLVWVCTHLLLLWRPVTLGIWTDRKVLGGSRRVIREIWKPLNKCKHFVALCFIKLN